MKSKFTFWTFTIFACLYFVTSVDAVTLEELSKKQTSFSNCSLQVTGAIVKGDAEKIEAVIAEATKQIFNYPNPDFDKQYVVCLSGPGGNYLEGIKIARIFSKFYVTTIVRNNETCLSACAIAFLGGRYNSRSGVGFSSSRYLFPDSTLGFHAPQLQVNEGDYSQKAVLTAYKIALDAISEIQKSARKLFIDEYLITEMFAHRGSDFYYISTVDDLTYFDIGLLGYRERKIQTDTRRAACWNAFNWNVTDNNNRLSSDEWNDVFQQKSDTLFGSKKRDTYTFFPFDGPMYCKISRPSNAPNTGPIQVILSESEDLSDPRAFFYTTPLILMRGNRLLSTTR